MYIYLYRQIHMYAYIYIYVNRGLDIDSIIRKRFGGMAVDDREVRIYSFIFIAYTMHEYLYINVSSICIYIWQIFGDMAVDDREVFIYMCIYTCIYIYTYVYKNLYI
jgi:hypothetical protein